MNDITGTLAEKLFIFDKYGNIVCERLLRKLNKEGDFS